MDQELSQQEKTNEKPKNNRRGLIILILLLLGIWFGVRPGIFTIQPIGALPEGITFIYHSRNTEMPFFSSPDGMCLEMQGSVNLLCRGSAISAAGDLTDRIILRLPYLRWAYLQSTGGLEFDG